MSFLTNGLRRIFDPLATLAGLALSASCVRHRFQKKEHGDDRTGK
jgi:hypothetical protein